MSSKLLTCLLIVLALAAVQGGHIYSYDPDIQFANVGYASIFTFYFSLESGLGATDYLELTMPGATSALLSTSMTPIVKLMSTGVSVSPTILAAVTSASNVYYVQPGAVLTANTWYVLQVTAGSTTNQVSQTTSKMYDPVQLKSCSFNTATTSTALIGATITPTARIYYDVNQVFATFSLGPTPSIALAVVFTAATDATNTANKVLIGAAYTFYLDITPKNGFNISTGAFYNVFFDGCSALSQGGYSFTGTCSNDVCLSTNTLPSCTANITALSNSACTVLNTITTPAVTANAATGVSAVTQITTTSLLFEYIPILNDGVTFRIKAQIQNPTYFYNSGTCSISVQEYSRANKKILYEVKAAIAIPTLNYIVITNNYIQYMWGLTPAYAGSLNNCPVGLYLQKANTATANKSFNNVKLTFTPSASTATGQNIFLKVAFPIGDLPIVIEGSINTNAPVASGKKIVCSFIVTDSAIVCRNIGPLSASAYTFAFRVSYVTGVTPTLGQITIYADILQTVGATYSSFPISTTAGSTGHAHTAAPNLQTNIESLRSTGYYTYGAAGVSLPLSPQIYSVPASTTSIIGTTANFISGVGGIVQEVSNTNYIVILIDADSDVVCGVATSPFNCESLAGTATSIAAALAIRLQIILNPNAFIMPTTATPNTVAAVTFPSPVKWSTTLAPIATNYYQTLTDSSNSAITPVVSYIVVNVICNPATASDAACSKGFYASGTPTSAAVLTLKQQPTIRPSNTADTMVLDFLVCFRRSTVAYSATATATTDAPFTTLVSQSLINSYLINIPSTNSVIKYGFVNLYQDAAAINTGSKIPVLMRLLLNLASTDASPGTQLSVFFNRGQNLATVSAPALSLTGFNVEGYRLTTVSATAYPASVAGPTSVATANSYTYGRAATTIIYTSNDDWASQTRVDIVTTVPIVYTNIYIPILQGIWVTSAVANQLQSLYLGVGTTDTSGQATMAKVFRLIGPQIALSTTSAGVVTFSVNTIYAISATNVGPMTQLASNTNFIKALVSPQVLASPATDIASVQNPTACPTTTAVANSDMTYAAATAAMYSGQITAGLTINAYVTLATACQALVANSYLTTNNLIGAHYSVASFGQDIFTGITSFTWSHKQSTINSDCVKVSTPGTTYPNEAGTVLTLPAIYMISCPYDQTAMASTDTLVIIPFTVPVNYGTTSLFSSLISQALTDQTGFLLAVGIGATSTFPVAAACTIAPTTPAWQINTQNQRVVYTTTLTKSAIVIPVSSNIVVQATLYSGANLVTVSVTQSVGSVCYHNLGSQVTCSILSTSTSLVTQFSLTASSVGAVTIPIGGTISITGLISHSTTTILSSTETGYTYGVSIFLGGVLNKIADCESTTSLRMAFQSGNIALAQVIATPTFDYSQAKKSKYDFSFTFTTANSKNVYSNEQFQFDIGWLQTPLSTYQTANAVRCVVLNGITNQIDFNWLTLDILTTPTSFLLVPKGDVTFASWRLKCYGAASPDSTSVATGLQSLKTNPTQTLSVQATATLTVTQVQNTNPTALSSTLVSNLNVTTVTPGLDSDFYFSTTSATYNYTVITGSRVYVQFPPSYLPRLNADGALSCKHNNTPANCEFVFSNGQFERFVRIYPVADMIINQIQNFVIVQVTQPVTLGSTAGSVSFALYVALDNDPNLANGVLEHQEQQLVQANSVDTTGATVQPLYILNYVQTSTFTRSVSDNVFTLAVPAGKMVAGGQFIIQFSSYLEYYLFTSSTLSCNLIRLSDSQVFGNNYCDVLPGWKVRMIVLTTDTTNSNVVINYQLTVSSVPTTIQALTNRWPTVIITDGTTAQKGLYRTTSTFQNSSILPSFTAANYTGVTLNWVSPIVNANKGYFDINSMASLQASSTSGKFISTFTYSSSSVNASSFKTVPATLTATVGFAASTFLIAASSTAPLSGKYILQYTRTVTDLLYIPIPPLRVNIVNNNCTINSTANSYDVPSQGFSLPIVFDFTNCMPINNIVYTANVTLISNVTAAAPSTLIQGLVAPVTAGVSTFQTLLGSQTNQTRLLFTVVNSDAIAITVASPAYAQVNVVVSGVDSVYFQTPVVVTINKVLKPTAVPVALSLTVLPSAGFATLNIRCDSTGVAYYAIAQNSSTLNIVSPSVYNQSAIATSSYAAGIQMTTPVQDQNWLIQGWLSVPVAGTVYPAIVQPVKAGANYTAIVWCTNLVNTVSAAAQTALWQQTSNGGLITQLAIQFSQTLTRTQLQQFACGIVTYAAIMKSQVVTELGDGCNNASQRILQTSTTNTTTNTSNTTNTTTTITTGSSQRFTVLPNYASAADTTSATVIAAVTQANSAAILSAAQLSGITVTSVTPTTYSTTNAFAVPVLATTTPQVSGDSTHLNITLQLTSGDGYLYAAAVNYQSSSLPTIAMLKAGTVFNTNSSVVSTVPVVAIANSYSAQNAVTLLSIYSLTGGLSGAATLTANTQYGIYFAATNADPSSNTLSTAVYRVNGTTNTNQNTFGSKIQISLFAFAVVIFALLF